MLKTDKKNLEDLASADESVRVQAAERFEQLDRMHFSNHPIGKFTCTDEQAVALLAAWHATSSELVKAWIAQLMALTNTCPPEALPVFVESLRFEGRYMETVSQRLLERREQISGGNDLFRSLHCHRNSRIRWRSAMALRSMVIGKEFDYSVDMPILRLLLLDTDPTVRNEAVWAAYYMDGLGPDDYEVLLDLANITSSSSSCYIKEIMTKLESTVPGCTPSAFAPREPLLRTDGVYSTLKAELDVAGNWISSGVLRFLPGNLVHYFGTNGSPSDWKGLPPGLKPGAQGTVCKNGAQISFSVTGDNGSVDYEGHIDGSELLLESTHRESGHRVKEKYQWRFVDWNAAPTVKPAPAKDSKGKKLPFIPARPKSMRMAEAGKWYLHMLVRLPRMLEGAKSDADRVTQGWKTKSDLRETAAKALIDQTLKKEFLAKTPLPALEALQAQDPAEAMAALLTVTPAEARAFPMTVGDTMGMTCWDGKQFWVMTENGWALKS